MAPFASPVTTVSSIARAVFIMALLLDIAVGALCALTFTFALSEHMWGWAAFGFVGSTGAVVAFSRAKRNARIREIAKTFAS